MADTLEQIAVQLAFQLGFVCSCRVLKDYPPDGPVCHGCRVTSRIRSALQSLARERDARTLREAFNAGFRWCSSGLTDSGEYNGGDLEDGFAAFTARLSVQEPRQEEENASHGLRDVQPVLTPKPDATASVVDKCRCGHMRYDHSTLKGCIGCACSRFFWVPDVDQGKPR
jgi:hypothetical protein